MARSDEKIRSIIHKSHEEKLVNYDFEKVTIEDIDGEKEVWKFNSVKVSKIDKDAIVPAIIRQKYSVDEELKLHRLALADPTDAEFAAYNLFVEDAKLVADIILGKIALVNMTVNQLDRTAKVYGLEDYPVDGLKADKLAYLEANL
jgi:hypothetical protein